MDRESIRGWRGQTGRRSVWPRISRYLGDPVTIITHPERLEKRHDGWDETILIPFQDRLSISLPIWGLYRLLL